MIALLAVLLLVFSGAAQAAVVETRVFEAGSPEIFEAAIKSIRVQDPTGQNQNFSLGSSWTCYQGQAFKINNYVKPLAAGIGELDMTAGVMTFGYQYEVRPVIKDGELEYSCSRYGVDSYGRPTGACVAYECTVTKEPVFGDAKKVVHGRVIRFRNEGTKYTVSYELVPSDTQFRRELENAQKSSDRDRLKWAKEEAESVFKSLKDVLHGMSRNAANAGRKLQSVESLLTDADRAAAATGPAGLYRLTTIDGQTLPYTTIAMGIEIAEGSFVIHADGKFTQTFITNRGSVQMHGKYKLNGSSIVLVEKSGSMMAGNLADNREISISGSYGRLVFTK